MRVENGPQFLRPVSNVHPIFLKHIARILHRMLIDWKSGSRQA